jgi:hypothetical protein
MPFVRSEARKLSAPPIMIARSLHQIAEKDDPRVAIGAFYLPEAVHARFRQKVFLYREANILLALLDRVKPSRAGGSGDTLFKPVFLEYELIIFGEAIPRSVTKRQSVKPALNDLNALMHPSRGNRFDIAREWSRKWFADIGHNELNPASLTRFSAFWFSEYTTVQKRLGAAVISPELF